MNDVLVLEKQLDVPIVVNECDYVCILLLIHLIRSHRKAIKIRSADITACHNKISWLLIFIVVIIKCLMVGNLPNTITSTINIYEHASKSTCIGKGLLILQFCQDLTLYTSITILQPLGMRSNFIFKHYIYILGNIARCLYNDLSYKATKFTLSTVGISAIIYNTLQKTIASIYNV